VALASPPLRRSNASLERLLDGSWYAAAPTSSREALLMPQCRLRAARRGCAEGALHGLEDSPYPARMRKAPPTSQGARSPGRRIAGGKGMCARRAHHAPPARRCPSTIARFAMGFSGSNRRAGTIADGTARVPPPGRGPSADFPRAVETGDADTSACAEMSAGCADRPGAHRDGPADGRNGRVSGVAATRGRIACRPAKGAGRGSDGLRAELSAPAPIARQNGYGTPRRSRHGPRCQGPMERSPMERSRSFGSSSRASCGRFATPASGSAGHSSRSTWQMPTSR